MKDINKDFLREIGLYLRDKRKKMGIRQVDLAEKTGITYRHYQEIEAGRVDCRISTLKKISEHLGVDLGEVVSRTREARGSHFYRVMDRSPFSVQKVDMDGVITYINRAHEKLHGYASSEIIGRKRAWELAADPEFALQMKEKIQQVIKDQPVPEPFELSHRKKDGSRLNLRVRWDYVRNTQNKVTGFILTMVESGGPVVEHEA